MNARIRALTILMLILSLGCSQQLRAELPYWTASVNTKGCQMLLQLGKDFDLTDDGNITTHISLYLGFGIAHFEADNPYLTVLDIGPDSLIFVSQIWTEFELEEEGVEITDVEIKAENVTFSPLLDTTSNYSTISRYYLDEVNSQELFDAIGSGQAVEYTFTLDGLDEFVIPIEGDLFNINRSMLDACFSAVRGEGVN